MALEFLNECIWRATSAGTGAFVPFAAAQGYYTPAQCTEPTVVVGGTYEYRAQSDDLTEYESGRGIWNGTNLARTHIIQSSNAGAAVNFAAAPIVIMGAAAAYSLATGPQALVIDSTGTWTPTPVFEILPQQGFQIGESGELISPTGAWVEGLGMEFGGMTTLEFVNLVGVRSGIDLSGPDMEVLEFPALVVVGGQFSTNISTLETLALPALQYALNGFSPGGDAITTLDIDSLEFAGSFQNNDMNALTSLSAPSLVSVGGDLSLNGLSSATTLDMSALVSVRGSLSIGANSTCGFLAVSFPALTDVGVDFDVVTAPDLTTLSLAALLNVGGILRVFDSVPNLANVTLNAGLLSVVGNVTFTGCALTQTAVDHILVRLAALDGTGGTTSYDNLEIDLSGGTSSAPSATGLAAKATLEGRGNTVSVN